MYLEYLEWVWLVYGELKGLCNKNCCGILKVINIDLLKFIGYLEIISVEM